MKQLTTGEFCSAAHKKAYLAEQEKFALARLLDNQKRIGGMGQAPSPASEKKKQLKRKAGTGKSEQEDAALATMAVEGTYLVDQVRAIPSRPILALPPSNPAVMMEPLLPECLVGLKEDREAQLAADAVVLPEWQSSLSAEQATAENTRAEQATAEQSSITAPYAASPEYAVQEIHGMDALFFLLERVNVAEESLLPPSAQIATATLVAADASLSIGAGAGPHQPLPVGLEYPSATKHDSPVSLGLGQELAVGLNFALRPRDWVGQAAFPTMQDWLPLDGEKLKTTHAERRPVFPAQLELGTAAENRLAEGLSPKGDDGAILRPFGAWAMTDAYCVFPASGIAQGAIQGVLPQQPEVALPERYRAGGFQARPSRPLYDEFAIAKPFFAANRIACLAAAEIAPAQPRSENRLVQLDFDLGKGSAPARKLRANGETRFGKSPLLLPTAKSKVKISHEHQSVFSALGHLTGGSAAFSWTGFRANWSKVPNDLRWVALAIPVVIGLIWFSSQPSETFSESSPRPSVSANQSTELTPQEQRVKDRTVQEREDPGWLGRLTKDDSLEDLKRSIQQRAAIELSDDFRQGLADWSGVGDWASGWRYDRAGFLRPRKLALYTPSLDLSDYRLEFLAHIETKALSWVFRAADVQNYYVNRLEIIDPEPLPTIVHVRYAVVNGKPGPRTVTRLPMQVQLDTLYRVRVDVKGNDFVTSIQGQVVDVFSDDRMPRGGVGFFANPGEEVRLRWVEVSHQYDFLGRLCAFLVPYNVSNNNLRSGQ